MDGLGKWWKSLSEYAQVFLSVATVGTVLTLGILISRHNFKQSAASSSTIGTAELPAAKPISKYDDPAQFSPDDVASVVMGFRITMGVFALSRNLSLDGAARMHANDMHRNNYSGLTEPNGSTALSRIETATGSNNIFYYEIWDNTCSNVTDTNETAKFLSDYDSVITDVKYRDMGIGYAPSDVGKCNGYIVLDFAGPQ